MEETNAFEMKDPITLDQPIPSPLKDPKLPPVEKIKFMSSSKVFQIAMVVGISFAITLSACSLCVAVAAYMNTQSITVARNDEGESSKLQDHPASSSIIADLQKQIQVLTQEVNDTRLQMNEILLQGNTIGNHTEYC